MKIRLHRSTHSVPPAPPRVAGRSRREGDPAEIACQSKQPGKTNPTWCAATLLFLHCWSSQCITSLCHLPLVLGTPGKVSATLPLALRRVPCLWKAGVHLAPAAFRGRSALAHLQPWCTSMLAVSRAPHGSMEVRGRCRATCAHVVLETPLLRRAGAEGPGLAARQHRHRLPVGPAELHLAVLFNPVWCESCPAGPACPAALPLHCAHATGSGHWERRASVRARRDPCTRPRRRGRAGRRWSAPWSPSAKACRQVEGGGHRAVSRRRRPRQHTWPQQPLPGARHEQQAACCSRRRVRISHTLGIRVCGPPRFLPCACVCWAAATFAASRWGWCKPGHLDSTP